MLYYHAERLNYAVIGTGNKNEHEQGFFVKYGDGSADIKPIAHLFKTQVFQLAEYLNIPKEILGRTPTTDTYSAECTQEEFFFRVPFEIGDLAWLALEKEIPRKKISQEKIFYASPHKGNLLITCFVSIAGNLFLYLWET